jgi:hypothetical protein
MVLGRTNILDMTQTALEIVFLHLSSLQNVYLGKFNLSIETVNNFFIDMADIIISLA